MAYYNVCPDCGSNLDPGEICECKRRTTEPEERNVYELRGDVNYGGHIAAAGGMLPRRSDRAARVG